MITKDNIVVRSTGAKLKLEVIRRLSIADRMNSIPTILPKQKLIFIHIPKTGGSSVANALENLCDRDKKIAAQPLGKLQPNRHLKAKEVKYLLGEKIWYEFFSFAFVRNPWDLMVSQYHWWLQKASQYPGCRKDVEKIKRMGNFTNFLNSKYGQKMFHDTTGNMFDWISEDEKIVVDFVGKFENFQSDLDEVCQSLNIEPIKLPHTNKTKRKPYQDYYNEETKQFVAHRFQKTIEMFGYEF